MISLANNHCLNGITNEYRRKNGCRLIWILVVLLYKEVGAQ